MPKPVLLQTGPYPDWVRIPIGDTEVIRRLVRAPRRSTNSAPRPIMGALAERDIPTACFIQSPPALARLFGARP